MRHGTEVFYLDTSALVTAMTPESARLRVRTWLLAHQANSFISAWSITEFASALSVKSRQSGLSHDDRVLALAQFDRYAAEVSDVLPVGTADFRLAATFCADPASGLRAGDALHLAVGVAHGLTIVTRDRLMASAAIGLGIPAIDLDEAA